MNAKQLREQADQLFSKRGTLMLLWQDIAENFYVERADFTVNRTIGVNYADQLSTSYPLMCRRDLGDSIGEMLRPTAKAWSKAGTGDEKIEDNEAKQYLQWVDQIMRRAMYDPRALFNRAMKAGDQDFGALGQCVVSVELNKRRDTLLYRNWHLRDCVWKENESGGIGFFARKWKPTARDLNALFPGKLDAKIQAKAEKEPFVEINCMHIVVEVDWYDGTTSMPYWSIVYDCENNKLIEAVPMRTMKYRVPRWQTVSGSQYAYSPATCVALPEARLLQSMTYTLLEAGEKITNPPLIAVQDAIRSDIAIYAGGITWADMEYDEKTGEVLRPITQDARGMPIGIDMQKDSRTMIMQALFLNRIGLPPRDAQMTAFETAQRVQEWIRQALPLFAPMEDEYNGGIWEETFDLLYHNGGFGSPFNVPKALRNKNITPHFMSPLHDAIDQQKGQIWLQSKAILADAAAVDQTVLQIVDARVALRDVLDGIGAPAKWLRSETEVDKRAKDQQAQQAQAQLIASLQGGSQAAANLASAQKDSADAQRVAA